MKVRRVDFNPDEYIAGVGTVLRADQQGVYWMICALIYSEGGPVADDAQRFGSLCKIRPATARKIVQRLVDMGKLLRGGDGKLSQKRTAKELRAAQNRIETASENGAKGGRPRRKSQSDQANGKAAGFPSEKLTTNHQQSTITLESVRSNPRRPSRLEASLVSSGLRAAGGLGNARG